MNENVCVKRTSMDIFKAESDIVSWTTATYVICMLVNRFLGEWTEATIPQIITLVIALGAICFLAFKLAKSQEDDTLAPVFRAVCLGFPVSYVACVIPSFLSNPYQVSLIPSDPQYVFLWAFILLLFTATFTLFRYEKRFLQWQSSMSLKKRIVVFVPSILLLSVSVVFVNSPSFG